MTASLSDGRKRFVLVGLVAGVLAMFAASMFYRLDHPSTRVQIRQEKGGAGMGGMGGAAMERIRELMEKSRERPDDPEMAMELGNAFLEARAGEQAKVFFAKVAAKRPQDRAALRGLGMAQFLAGEHEESARTFEQTAGLDPQDAMSAYNLGVLYKHYLNRAKDAEQWFGRVLAMPGADPHLQEEARQELGQGHGKAGATP